MSSRSPIPRLIVALRDAARDLLPDVHVSDSYSTENPGAGGLEVAVTLAVGVDDPERVGQTQTASASSEWAATGRRLDLAQSGSVVSHLHAEAGTTDAELVREAVYAAFDELRELLRARSHNGVTLGVPGAWKVWLSDERLYQAQFEAGASADLMFTVSFEAIV